ncbi:hypothetical protein [Siphonobacter sp. SORGH_AS_1065]|uniref:hypothetical protein n=1 Tax=Siphonobacter sp. SORGH_AS_1065 TaxID=3041795 RepID=UPI00278708AD|nr:hypothetical protein [Siphonobacter sp. SORGH_AS_1065]MDQ1089515.1 hypothetical protein [Siphonobacter sp. SORGH_AS_1065]
MESTAIAIAAVLKKYRLPALWNYALATLEISTKEGGTMGLQWRNFPNQMKAAVITESLTRDQLKVVLLPIVPKEQDPIPHAGTYSFSEEQVLNYLEETGDDNPIHTGNLAIVPGLLLLSFLEKKILQKPLQSVSVRFYEALLVNENFDVEQRTTSEWRVTKGSKQILLTLKFS